MAIPRRLGPIRIGSFLLCCSALVICQIITLAQQTRNSQPASGYLNRIPPTNLRFSPPPKPPVAQLTQAGITGGTAPLFNKQFVDANSPTGEVAVLNPVSIRPPAGLGREPQSSGESTQSSEEAPVIQSLSPQMLVRFFEGAGRIVYPPIEEEKPRFHPPLQEEPGALAKAPASTSTQN